MNATRRGSWKHHALWLARALMMLGVSPVGVLGSTLAVPEAGIPEASRSAGVPQPHESRPASTRTMTVLPLAFTEMGKDDPGVFQARGPGYGLTLDRGRATVWLRDPRGEDSRARQRWSSFEIRLLGARRPAGTGVDPLSARASRFAGSDPRKWRSNLPLYESVRFEDVYEGIDIRYYGAAGTIEHDFEIAPGADPSRIRLAIKGADSVRVSGSGDLLIGIGGDEVVLHRPVAYQNLPEGRREVEAAYSRDARGTIGFRLGEYDPGAPLVVDPIITYSSFLGGSGNSDNATSVAYDHAGFAYIVGTTSSFPVTAGAFDTSITGSDAYVAKLDPNQTGAASLVWATYLGGEAGEATGDIAVDAASNVYVVVTAQDGFPTTAGAFDTTFNGSTDVAVVKINAAGSALVWSTFLGGSTDETGVSIAVELSGAVVVVGPTLSSNFPTTSSAYDRTLATAPDGFLSLLSPDGSRLLYSTLLGGNGVDSITSVAVDGQARAYVSGLTWSSDFPTTAGALDRVLGGTTDGFVARFDPSLTGTASLSWATYLGGSNNFEAASSIGLAPGDEPVVMGYTNSPDFPGIGLGFDSTLNGTQDIFVARLTNNGSTVTYGTLIGGSVSESFSAQSLAVDDLGRAHVAAGTTSDDFPATAGSINPCGGTQIAYTVVDTRVTGAASLVESGCAGAGSAVAMAVDACSNSALTGFTTSSAFPVINGYSATLGGTRDAFLMQLHSTGGATADLAVSVDDAPDPLFVGETVTHSVQVTNNGPNAANNVTLVHRTSAVIVQGTLPGQCEASGATVTCDLGTIGSGATVPLAFQGTAPLPGELWAEDRVSSPNDDANCSNNDDTTITTVRNPTLNLDAPNGGTVYASGDAVPIDWTAPAAAVKFNLDYSTTNGSKWISIVKGVAGRSYGWQVPAIKGNKSTCKVRVKAYDALGKGAGTDASDSAFTIEVLKLDTPNGGEAVNSNTTASIHWTTHATAKPVAHVKLQYSITGGGGWKTIVTLDGDPGSYDWTVPVVTSSKPLSKIRITLTDSGGGKLAKDESDAVFTINP